MSIRKYWLIFSLSVLWTMLAFVPLIEIFEQQPLQFQYDNWRDWLVILFVAHPFILSALLVRALLNRRAATNRARLISAALPLTTLAIAGLALAVGAAWHWHERQLILERLERRANSRISYHCSGETKNVDYDRANVGPTRLNLTVIHRSSQEDRWFVTAAGTSTVEAKMFPIKTGSYGGSTGLSWMQDGKDQIAILSFSDIYGEFGTATIWMNFATAPKGWESVDKKQHIALPDDWLVTSLTCGPDPASYREE